MSGMALSWVALASTSFLYTATTAASWDPAKMVFRSRSGLTPASRSIMYGKRYPEVEAGSTKAKRAPLRSARRW